MMHYKQLIDELAQTCLEQADDCSGLYLPGEDTKEETALIVSLRTMLDNVFKSYLREKDETPKLSVKLYTASGPGVSSELVGEFQVPANKHNGYPDVIVHMGKTYVQTPVADSYREVEVFTVMHR